MQTMKEFLTKDRGISEETLAEFGVTTKNGEAVLPFYSADKSHVLAEKRRVHESNGKRQFFWPVGRDLELYGLPYISSPCFITEGETDTMRLWQELHDYGTRAGVCGIPGIESWKPEWAKHFETVSDVYVILDNDADYNVRARVDKCWGSIRSSLGSKAKRIRLPDSCGDVCEFLDKFTISTLNDLVKKSKSGFSHFQALDLTKPPEPYDWLVDEWICQGDIVTFIGEPSIGKSMLAMDLAVGVAENTRNSWLNLELLKHGRVLYFDEENPEDVVKRRMKALGLLHPDQVRYIHNQGVRVDKVADKVMDEAWAFEPTLVVFDSLTRFHTGDENDAGFINELFGGCFKPLARDTGATVVILHHTTKGTDDSSFRRSRGSGDITASIDAGFDVSPGGNYGSLRVERYKSRRGAAGQWCYATIQDAPGGRIIVNANHLTI